MFKYIHSVILKGESDDNDATQSDGKLICNEKKRIDHWTQMIFPVHLNYESIEDKMVRDGKSKSDAFKQNSSNTVDWKALDWKVINADNKDKSTPFPIYPPMDPSKNMEWKKLISYSYSHTSKSDNQQTKS